jgi:hypothetical protein
MKPHRGTLILVFGILGIISCFPLGIAAWVMGRKDLKEMDAGTMDPSGRGNTNAGRICGMIGTLWLAVVLLLSLGAVILWLFVSISPKHEKMIAPAKPPAHATEPAR